LDSAFEDVAYSEPVLLRQTGHRVTSITRERKKKKGKENQYNLFIENR
jgi:hypothetical protein